MDKRMAGDYEIIHAFHIGDKEIVIGENTAPLLFSLSMIK